MKNPSPRNQVHEDGPNGSRYGVEEEISRYGVQRIL